ncbi:MAG: AzlD domain-containing protein [Clostridia bacterium]|nr:AzlD domain-containing protein [Clostridia bacterium]
MFKTPNFFIYLAVMVLITYLLRLLPMLIFKKKIRNKFIRSVLYYVPYSVLTVMAIPAMFFATSHVATGVVAVIAAVALAYSGRSLIMVAAGTATVVFIAELILLLLQL